MKLIFAVILITNSIFAYSQDVKTKFCSPTIEALESKGDIKIINTCGIDEKQIKLEFEKFRDTQRNTQKDIKLSLNKVALLFNEYQKINTEKFEKIHQGISDSNSKLDKLLSNQNIINQNYPEIDKTIFQEAVRRQSNDDLELILTTIPSLSIYSAFDTISKLIHDSEIYLDCSELVKVLTVLKKLGGIEFYGANFVLSILDKVKLPFHQTCYREVGSYVGIYSSDDVIQQLNAKKVKLQKMNSENSKQ